MSTVSKALLFAIDKHKGQVRRGSGADYITHPIAVSNLVAEYKKSRKIDSLLIASLLHDTIEDTDTTFVEIVTEFSPLVASLVLELTNDEELIAKLGKLEYQKKKLSGISNYALIIKLADRLHNITDLPTKKMIKDTIELITHLNLNRKLTKTQNALAFDIQSLCLVHLRRQKPQKQISKNG